MNLFDIFEAGEEKYVLYFNDKPVATYTNIPDAEYQARIVKKKVPDLNFSIKKEVCTYQPVQLKENLRNWFKEKWVRFGPDGEIRGDCARGDDSEGKPKCLPQSKAQSLGKKGRASAAARKRREDPNPERSGKAINVATNKKSNESLREFAIGGGDNGGGDDEEEILFKYAKMWYNAPYERQDQIEEILARMGWEIGEIETDEGGAFVVQPGDEHGRSYIGFTAADLTQDMTEEQLDELKCWSGFHRVPGTKAGFPGSCAKNKTNEEVSKKINPDAVRRIQQLLNKKFGANLDVDGEMGPLTLKSIKKFLPKSAKKQAPDSSRTTAVQGKEEKCPHCGGEMVSEELINEKKDACYYKVKSRYKVWPSAYASGALVKCRKKGADSWGNKSEGVAEGLFGIDDKIKGRIQNIVSDLSDIPGMWDHQRQTFTDAGMEKLKSALKNNPKYIKYALNLTYKDYEAEGVTEEFGPLPKDNQQIRLGRHTVDIERVGLDNNYIGFAWHDSQGQEHYEEVAVGDLGSYDDLITKIKQEISYQERQYTNQGVAEGSESDAYGNTGEKHECGSCDGTGIDTHDDECPECGGKGWVRDKESSKKKGVAEGQLGNVLQWPEVVNKINSAMKATGWKGQRQSDDAFMYSTKGQLDNEFYFVIIENAGKDFFTYALGTVEDGDPYIDDAYRGKLPNTEASVSELINDIRDGFRLNEQSLNEFTKSPGFGGDGDDDKYTPQDFGKPFKANYLGQNKFEVFCRKPQDPNNVIKLNAEVQKYGLEWEEDFGFWFLDSPGAVYLSWKYGEIPLPKAIDQARNPGHIHDLVTDYLTNSPHAAEIQKIATEYFGFTMDGDMNEGVSEDQLDEKWSQKYKDSINCSNPKGFSQKAHCAGEKKNEDIAEGKEYYTVIGTDSASLRREFNMAKDRNGWYLREGATPKQKLEAFRAFGSPKLKEFNLAAFSGGTQTKGEDNVISPVGSKTRAQYKK